MSFINQNNQENELEVNRKNREDYEQLMKDSSTNLDGFWDSNNIFVKIFLIILLVVIVGGSIIIFGGYFINK